jgi:restriction endonuclease Mrr
MTFDPLVDELARLDRQRRRELIDAAQQERQRRIRRALRKIRRAVLPGLKDRPAARAIDDAVRGRRTSFRNNPALRQQIEQQLKQELGSLDDIPGAERIRQLLRL